MFLDTHVRPVAHEGRTACSRYCLSPRPTPTDFSVHHGTEHNPSSPGSPCRSPEGASAALGHLSSLVGHLAQLQGSFCSHAAFCYQDEKVSMSNVCGCCGSGCLQMQALLFQGDQSFPCPGCLANKGAKKRLQLQRHLLALASAPGDRVQLQRLPLSAMTYSLAQPHSGVG